MGYTRANTGNWPELPEIDRKWTGNKPKATEKEQEQKVTGNELKTNRKLPDIKRKWPEINLKLLENKPPIIGNESKRSLILNAVV